MTAPLCSSPAVFLLFRNMLLMLPDHDDMRVRHRPISSEVAKESLLPPVKSTWTVEQKLKGWDAAQAKFFKVQFHTPPKQLSCPSLDEVSQRRSD